MGNFISEFWAVKIRSTFPEHKGDSIIYLYDNCKDNLPKLHVGKAVVLECDRCDFSVITHDYFNGGLLLYSCRNMNSCYGRTIPTNMDGTPYTGKVEYAYLNNLSKNSGYMHKSFSTTRTEKLCSVNCDEHKDKEYSEHFLDYILVPDCKKCKFVQWKYKDDPSKWRPVKCMSYKVYEAIEANICEYAINHSILFNTDKYDVSFLNRVGLYDFEKKSDIEKRLKELRPEVVEVNNRPEVAEVNNTVDEYAPINSYINYKSCLKKVRVRQPVL